MYLEHSMPYVARTKEQGKWKDITAGIAIYMVGHESRHDLV
jgi:hypothetical protein